MYELDYSRNRWTCNKDYLTRELFNADERCKICGDCLHRPLLHADVEQLNIDMRGYVYAGTFEVPDVDSDDSDYKEELTRIQKGRANARYYALSRAEQQREDARKSKEPEVEVMAGGVVPGSCS